MAHSREVRLPFLSHELVEFLFSLPATFKINEGWTKWIMRETFDILPHEIGWRTDKIGYEPPQKNWMESEIMKNKFIHSKELLIKNNYFNKSILDEKVNTQDTGDLRKNSWGYLMASSVI
jgi:asparagine synthase (glutamine-hydrolysing)